jgi:hypothetical protein
MEIMAIFVKAIILDNNSRADCFVTDRASLLSFKPFIDTFIMILMFAVSKYFVSCVPLKLLKAD